MTEDEQGRPDDESTDRGESGAPADANDERFLPAADPPTSDAEKYSTDEGRTEEDLTP